MPARVVRRARVRRSSDHADGEALRGLLAAGADTAARTCVLHRDPCDVGLDGLHRADDRAVHAVRCLERRRDLDVGEAGRLQAFAVLGEGQGSGDAADEEPRSARSAGVRWSSATTSEMPRRPPGRRTRKVSANTAGLSMERLMTQLEITTSMVLPGNGMASMLPLRNSTLVAPALSAFDGRARASRRSCPGRRPCRWCRPGGRRAGRRCRRRSPGPALVRPRAVRRRRWGCRSPGRPPPRRREARRGRPRGTAGAEGLVDLRGLRTAAAASALADGGRGGGVAGTDGLAQLGLLAHVYLQAVLKFVYAVLRETWSAVNIEICRSKSRAAAHRCRRILWPRNRRRSCRRCSRHSATRCGCGCCR